MTLDLNSFFSQVLQRIGAPITNANLAFLNIMQRGEGGDGPERYNPLNSTLPMPGSWTINSVGVRGYQTESDGVIATAATLAPSSGTAYYPTIVHILRSGPTSLSAFVNPAVEQELMTWQGGSHNDWNLLCAAAGESPSPSPTPLPIPKEGQTMDVTAGPGGRVDVVIIGQPEADGTHAWHAFGPPFDGSTHWEDIGGNVKDVACAWDDGRAHFYVIGSAPDGTMWVNVYTVTPAGWSGWSKFSGIEVH